MELSEVLKYLELPASASVTLIQTRIEEKLRYLEGQWESMGTDFLKKMHQRNIDRAVAVKAAVMAWKDEPELEEEAIPVANNIAADDIVVNDVVMDDIIEQAPSQEIKDSIFITKAPLIIGSKSKLSLDNPHAKEPLGWLVRHMENQTAVTFTIFAGKNYLGRKKQDGITNFIVIDDDVFISRIHAVIDAEESGDSEFYISDSESSNLGKPSKNGTYINGDDKRISQKIRLSDNDTIQVGVTKMILKVNRDNNLKKIIKEVQNIKFMDTIIINPE